MAERRMFAKTITTSDQFLKLSKDARLLYYCLGMAAYDKGIVINAKSTAQVNGLDVLALAELITAGYIMPVEDGHYLIVHWYENNGIGETAKQRNNYSYRQWRKAVLERDGFKCAYCGSTENLEAHHIKEFSTHIDKPVIIISLYI